MLFAQGIDWKNFLVLPDLKPASVPQVRIVGEKKVFMEGDDSPEIEFEVKEDGYAFVFHINAKKQMLLIWPDLYLDRSLNNFVESGRKVTIPSGYYFTGDYTGREYLQVIVFKSETEALRELKNKFADLAYQGKYVNIDAASFPIAAFDLIDAGTKGELKRKGVFASNMADFYYGYTPDLKEVTFETPTGAEFLFVDGILVTGNRASLEPGSHLMTFYHNSQRKDVVTAITSSPVQRVQVPLSQTPGPVAPNQKAVLLSVGISQFRLPPTAITYLKGPEKDAKQIVTTMEDLYKKMGIGLETRLLVNQNATKSAMMEGLNWLLTNADGQTDVFFYYSGHGTEVPDQDGDEATGQDQAFIPYDYEETIDSVILDDTLYQVYRQIAAKARRFVLLIDACHSGGLYKNTDMVLAKGFYFRGIQTKAAFGDLTRSSTIEDLSEIEKNVFFISAARSNERALDALQGDTYSPFTKYLIEALNRQKNSSARSFSLQEAFSTLSSSMELLFEGRYKQYKHTPQFLRHAGADFVIQY